MVLNKEELFIEDKNNEIYIKSEYIAFQIAGILNKKNERLIDYNLVYEVVKLEVKNEELIDDVVRKTISLLEDKYGILFDVDKNIEKNI